MPLPTITPLPEPPLRDDPDFADKAGAFVEALPPFRDELMDYVEAFPGVYGSATYSSLSTTSREISSGTKTFQIEAGKMFVAGQDIVISSGANLTTRKMWATVGSYDIVTGWLSADVTALIGAGNTHADWIIGLSGAPGIDSGGALTNPIVTGTITEDVHAIVDGASVMINAEDGSIQTWTLGANRTPDITMVEGQAITLMIADGSAYSVTWSTVNPTWVGGSAPTLPTTGYAVIVLFKVASTIYAAYVGNVA